MTRLYFHTAAPPSPPSGSYPTTSNATWAPPDGKSIEAQSVHRSMDSTIGTGQVEISTTTIGSTAFVEYYVTKFISPLLTGVSSISSNTWTTNFAAKESSLTANFPAPAGGDTTNVCVYVWRPSTQAVVGYMRDDYTTNNITEGASANTEYSHNVTWAGSAVSGVQNNDVIIYEQWFEFQQGSTSTFTIYYYYDGTTATTSGNQVVSNHASFVETPQTLTFVPTEVTMTEAAAKTYSNKFITKV